ncbi:Alpha/Beta hydrolase protein [Plectosphaerella plurivora]|uniref:Alpha/Beta hydrolase protein n=1 Tax=Plectosphaerella plurivora TaxID=936078 RepID=A0A9P9A5V5_9PEZI|nr:Alpha/Beta hydrolase protein [Plectosphaerella plurivora]
MPKPSGSKSSSSRGSASRSSASRSSASSSGSSNAADRKAIVIIPAAYSGPDLYEKVAAYCRSFGSEVVVVQNPSTDVRPRAPSLYDDATNARAQIERLVRRGKEVMVVGHAYGAMVATQCCQGLSTADVSRGGVVRLLFIAGIAAVEGQSALDAMAGMAGPGLPEGMAASLFPSSDCQDGYGWYSQETIAAFYYTSAPPEEAMEYAAGRMQQSTQSLLDPLTHAGYRYIPVTYMVLDDDATLPQVLQESYVGVIEATSGQVVDVVHYPSDHFPSVTRPEAVIDCLWRAAGEEVIQSCNFA